jgi:hypothetical protein
VTYEEILKNWGRLRLLADKPELGLSDSVVEVTSVDIYECESMGYCETCWSPAYIDITINYTVDGVEGSHYLNAREDEGWADNDFNTLTGIVRELEKLAEDMDRKGE